MFYINTKHSNINNQPWPPPPVLPDLPNQCLRHCVVSTSSGNPNEHLSSERVALELREFNKLPHSLHVKIMPVL